MIVEEIKELIDTGKLDYGSVWSESELITMFDIQLPDLSGNANSILKNATDFNLKKLSAYCAINEQLLNCGRVFIQDKDVYRVPIISETTYHINKYYSSSNKKFKKAEKLRKSFSNANPIEAKEVNDKVNRTVSMRSSQDKQYQPMA